VSRRFQVGTRRPGCARTQNHTSAGRRLRPRRLHEADTTACSASAAYAEHRASEAGAPVAWPTRAAVPGSGRTRSRQRVTFDRFMECAVRPRRKRAALRVLDLGAGNGWLCYRLHRMGHFAVALDLRTDLVDGLGAAAGYGELLPELFPRVAAAFEQLPVRTAGFDMAVFNASLHYATDLAAVVAEAARCVVGGGCVAILDTPWYRRRADGAHGGGEARTPGRFGRAGALPVLAAVEFLTPERLAPAASLNLTSPVSRAIAWYELRPGRLRGGGHLRARPATIP
jgi:SAM-dependent methyltransferase